MCCSWCLPRSSNRSGLRLPMNAWVGCHAGMGARWEQRLPVHNRNMALLPGLLVLSLSCLQGPCSAVSLGCGLGRVGRGQGSEGGRGGALIRGRMEL